MSLGSLFQIALTTETTFYFNESMVPDSFERKRNLNLGEGRLLFTTYADDELHSVSVRKVNTYIAKLRCFLGLDLVIPAPLESSSERSSLQQQFISISIKSLAFSLGLSHEDKPYVKAALLRGMSLDSLMERGIQGRVQGIASCHTLSQEKSRVVVRFKKGFSKKIKVLNCLGEGEDSKINLAWNEDEKIFQTLGSNNRKKSFKDITNQNQYLHFFEKYKKDPLNEKICFLPPCETVSVLSDDGQRITVLLGDQVALGNAITQSNLVSMNPVAYAKGLMRSFFLMAKHRGSHGNINPSNILIFKSSANKRFSPKLCGTSSFICEDNFGGSLDIIIREAIQLKTLEKIGLLFSEGSLVEQEDKIALFAKEVAELFLNLSPSNSNYTSFSDQENLQANCVALSIIVSGMIINDFLKYIEKLKEKIQKEKKEYNIEALKQEMKLKKYSSLLKKKVDEETSNLSFLKKREFDFPGIRLAISSYIDARISADMFAFGKVLIESNVDYFEEEELRYSFGVLAGDFEEKQQDKAYKDIRRIVFSSQGNSFLCVGEALRLKQLIFICKCVHPNLKKRPDFRQIGRTF
jgi:hypothetical protein